MLTLLIGFMIAMSLQQIATTLNPPIIEEYHVVTEDKLISVVYIKAKPKSKPKPKTEKKKEVIKVMSTEDLIRKYCENTSVNANIAVAISRWETGYWTSNACKYYYNYGGMMLSGKLMKFNSEKDGIKAFVNMLDKYYFSKGLTTIEEIGSKYCPGSHTWVQGVKSVMGVKT